MDESTRRNVAMQIQAVKARLPELEKDLADARSAGLGDIVKTQEETLAKLKSFLVKLDAVYG